MTRLRIVLVPVVVCVLLLVAAQARAQDLLDRLIGQPIAAVEVQIERKPETAAPLLALVDIKPGDRFALDAVRKVSDRFNQVPRFLRVRVLAEERPTGVVLIFDLEPRHPVDQLAFTGDTGLSEQTLQDQVREQFNGIPAVQRLGDVEDTVRRLLGYEGYRSATATAEIVEFHDPDRATLRMNVNAGPRSTIASIEVRGQSPLSREQILSRLGLAVGAPYRPRALASGLAEIRDDLRAQGYYTAIAQDLDPGDDPQVALVLIVEAGPHVRLEVNGPLPGSVDDFIPIKRQGSVDRDLLEDAQIATERAWRAQGYWRARVEYTETTPSPDERLITFTIDRGRRYRIVSVDLPPGLQLTPAETRSLEALEPDTWFSQVAATRALAILTAFYQLRGFYEVRMDPRFDEVPGRSPGEGGVVVRPNIVEGRRATVSRIVFDLGDGARVTEAQLRSVMRAREQAPYVPAYLVLDRQALEAYYESLGYLNRAVVIRPEFNDAGTDATLRVQAREGARVVVGEIIVVGNERTSRDVILQEITLRPNQPYSEAARLESQRRLLTLSGFRDVRITAEPRLPGETETRIIISVEEASAITVGLGGGVEAATTPRSVEGGGVEDRFEVSPRAFVEFGRRNLGGRNRAINLFARIALKPRNAPGDPELDGQGFGFAEYRVTGTYRERYAFHSNTDLLFGFTSEQAVRTSFNFVRRVANAELLHPITPRLSVSGRYSLEFTELFDERILEREQSLIDRLFPQVRLSILSSALLWDRRDDQIGPSRGEQLSASVDLAPGQLGSEVGFVKSFLQVSLFRPVVGPRRVVFAGRVQLGLARGFERRVPRLDEDGEPVLDPGGDPIVDVVADLPASQRYFAGGSTTVRGFQLDRLGVREILNANGLSNGGNAMIVTNAELRVHAGRLLDRDLSLVGFLDAGNVFDRVSNLSLARLRASAGFGFRYDSPVGPIRLDFGFKFDRFTFATARERRWEFHLSLGEVF